MKILMVCLGNICRSPLADGLLREKVAKAGLSVEVDSAETSDHHVGQAPDSRMRATAKAFGYSIDDLRARQFVQGDFDTFDLIYVMDKSNYANVISLSRNEGDRNKVKLILNELNPGRDLEVPDPYFGREEGFIEVFDLLDEATNVILAKVSKK